MKKLFLSLLITLTGVMGMQAQSAYPDYPALQLGKNMVTIKDPGDADFSEGDIDYTLFKFVAPATGVLQINSEDRSVILCGYNGLIPDAGSAGYTYSVYKDSTYYIGCDCEEAGEVDYELYLGLLPMEKPVTVTKQNYDSLGLDASYIGSCAICNRAQFFCFAYYLCGTQLRFLSENDFSQSAPMRNLMSASRRVLSDDADGEGTTDSENTSDSCVFVLATDIVVNEDLFDNGNINITKNGQPRKDIIHWSTIDLRAAYDSTSFVFDGNGHTISGLFQLTLTGNDEYIGFVTNLNKRSAIRNLGITQSFIGAYSTLSGGIFVAMNNGGTIENCWSDAMLTASMFKCLGGIVGYSAGNSTIKDCRFSGYINAYGECGGIIGYCQDSIQISNCHFSGSANVSNELVDFAGIAYYFYGHKISIDRCSAEGKVEISARKGAFSGIVSYLNYEDSFQIRNCYNAVNADGCEVYGICKQIGYNNLSPDKVSSSDSSVIKNCFCYKNAIVPIADISNCPAEIKNCFYLVDEDTEDEEKGAVSAKTFASGKIAYLLSQENDSVWFQNLGKEQPYPVLKSEEPEHETVMYDSLTLTYFNKPYVLTEYTLCDEVAYDCKRAYMVDSLTYERTFLSTKWEALYVPFELPVDSVAGIFDIAAIHNFHEYYDAEGKIEYRELEVRILKSGKTKANYPYLIRAKEAGEKSVSLKNVQLYDAKDNSIACASTSTKYIFSGTCSGLPLDFDASYVMNGYLYASDYEIELPAQRWYLTAETYDYQWEDQAVSEPVSLSASAIRIFVMGEEETGIETIDNAQSSTAIYNLQGQRLCAPQKGLQIVNGKRLLNK